MTVQKHLSILNIMIKTFAYLRVSDPSQVKGDGFTRQEKACRDYAKSHNLDIIQVYREDISGSEEYRPVLAELLLSLEKNHHGVKTVIIERLDRLARDLMIQEGIVSKFKTAGFNLISAIEGDELLANDPTRKFIRQVLGAVAELDKSMLVAKLRASRERKRARGEKADGRYGYKDTEQGRELVKYIKSLHRKPKYGRRRTLKLIAEQLNKEGILTINRRVWTISSVRDVIFER